MRGAARNELLGLPAPHPLKDALLNIDRFLSQVEVDIRRVQAAVPVPSVPRPVLGPPGLPPDIRDLTSRFDTWWGRGESRYRWLLSRFPESLFTNWSAPLTFRWRVT